MMQLLMKLRVCPERSIWAAIGSFAFWTSSACIDESCEFACFGFLVRTQIARSRLTKHLSGQTLTFFQVDKAQAAQVLPDALIARSEYQFSPIDRIVRLSDSQK